MRKIEVRGECWLWTGALQPDGYARTVIDGVRMGVHEAAHLLFVGAVPDGLELDHTCRVRHCCRPDHLEAVTREENMRRMRRPREAARTWTATHCVNGHEYTADNTYIDPSQAHRRCRECARIGNAVIRANRKAAAANARLDTVDALADATAAHLRMLGRWQPGTLAALLGGAS